MHMEKSNQTYPQEIVSALMDIIKTRRSIRFYTDEPVPEDVLSQIIEAGLFAPSGVNFQPWYFVVIRTQENRDRLLSIMQGVSKDAEPMLEDRFRNHPQTVHEVTGFLKTLGNAPVVILAFQLKDSYPKEGDVIPQSIGAAIQNMLLAAHAMGLGTCWIGAPSETGADTRIREMFAPDKGPFMAMITLGYPAKVPPAPKRKDGRFVLL